MDKVVLLSDKASIESIILRVNELSTNVRANEIRIDRVEVGIASERLQSITELHSVSDDIKKHFDRTLKDSLREHTIEVVGIITQVRSKVSEIEETQKAMGERISALEVMEREAVYSRWQGIKAWFVKLTGDSLNKILLLVIMTTIAWIAGILSWALFS